MSRADARANEHLAQRVQASVEAAAAPVPRSAEGTAAASSSSSRPAQEAVSYTHLRAHETSAHL
eukprot:10095791-Alexandrium_andersonii.AAC.1